MIDLHNHSNYSDGLYKPAKIVENAVRDGLNALALCDHDCTWGLAEAKQKADELNIDFIPGVELTVNVHNDKDHPKGIHILGLFIKATPHLEEIHARNKKVKDNFSFNMADAMRQEGINIHVKDIQKHFQGAINMGAFGEYMIHQKMVEKFKDFEKIVDNLIEQKKLAPRPELGIPADEAIEAIHEAGGLAILAHPYRMNLSDNVLFNRIKKYKEMGLDGLECFYTNYKNDAENKIKKSLQMALDLGLLISGGSDYHQDTKRGRFPDAIGIQDEVLLRLKQARFKTHPRHPNRPSIPFARVRD